MSRNSILFFIKKNCGPLKNLNQCPNVLFIAHTRIVIVKRFFFCFKPPGAIAWRRVKQNSQVNVSKLAHLRVEWWRTWELVASESIVSLFVAIKTRNVLRSWFVAFCSLKYWMLLAVEHISKSFQKKTFFVTIPPLFQTTAITESQNHQWWSQEMRRINEGRQIPKKRN